jgi:hypothetical protein
MKAKLVHLTDRQFEHLTDQAGKLGISVSELIRRILDDHMDSIRQWVELPKDEKGAGKHKK